MRSEEDLRANPRPWLTDDSIQFIEANLRPTDRVIEFGGGWSTIWWTRHVAWTLTIEASPKWAAKIISEMSAHPRLLVKWSLRFAAAEWHTKYTQAKNFWTKHARVLSDDIAKSLEDAYLAIEFSPDVFVIDGSVRPGSVHAVDRHVRSHEDTRMIVVDNMESMAKHVEGKFPGFTQHDFPEYDLEKIPAHQNGKWTTSVWLRP